VKYNTQIRSRTYSRSPGSEDTLKNTFMDLKNFRLATKRLLLVPISMKYKDDIFREFTPEVATYLYHKPGSITDTENFINQSLEKMSQGKSLDIVILTKDSQEFLGCSGIDFIDNNLQPGIWLKKSAHNFGYGLETISALKKWCDDNLDYEYLIYPVDKDNTRSRQIPEKLEGEIFKESQITNLAGRVLNLVEYRISKTLNISSNVKI
jgi:[ribosomal protein S5]-alanine N-acetyltransferase